MMTETKKTKGQIKTQIKYDAKVRDIATKLTNEEFELLRDIAPTESQFGNDGKEGFYEAPPKYQHCRMFKLSKLKERFGEDVYNSRSEWFKHQIPLMDYPLPRTTLKSQGLIYVECAGGIIDNGYTPEWWCLTNKLIIARASARLQLFADQNKITISYHGDIDGVNVMCFRFVSDVSDAVRRNLPQWVYYCIPTPLGKDVLKYRMSLSKQDETMSFIINTKHISDLTLEELQRCMVAIDYHMSRLDPKNA